MNRDIILSLTAVSCSAVCVYWRKDDIRRSLSSLLENCSKKTRIASDVSRDQFSTTELCPPKPVDGHTHATAASLRTSATAFARIFAANCGGVLYSCSQSKSDQRKGIRGERQWYWAKDVNATNAADSESPDDIMYLCDVDYYKDMPEFLARTEKTVLLYTVVPESAAGTGIDDTSYYFEEDGRLRTFVAGGGTYIHQLWDYGYDSVIVYRRFMGIKIGATVYSIERKQVGYSRQLILLSPLRTFNVLGSWLSSFLLETPLLKRFNPIVKGNGMAFTRFRVHRQNETYITTAICGQHLAADIPARVDEAIAIVARNGSTPIVLPTVAGWIGPSVGDEGAANKAAAAVLMQYYRCVIERPKLTVYPVEKAVRSYNYAVSNYVPEDKPKLEAFMSPLVHAAFTPIMNKEAEAACVKGRINNLKGPEPKPNQFVDQCMLEFTDLVVRGSTLFPVNVETVVAKQTRSAQKLSLRKAMDAGPFLKRLLKCFLKAEAYADVKDPRNISTFNDADKLTMAQFALALSEHLKQFRWYGPGKTPLEISTIVANICENAISFVNASDMHRMDGTVKYRLRMVDRMIFMRAFGYHRAEMNELLNRNCDNKGILPHGTSFEQDSSQGSGCSATSVSQTLRNAFNSYLAYRHTRKPDGSYYSPEEAFRALGIYLGDDGLQADLPIESHKWASERVGLVLEAIVVEYGQPGVSFLARYYSPQVWNGRLDSMCDVKRQLSKFHTTVRLPNNVRPEEKMVEKARGYVATDGNTPVIGRLCKRALDLNTARSRRDLGIAPWWSKFEQSVQYPNSNADQWMDAEFQRLFPEFNVEVFNSWINTVTCWRELLGAPLCCEPKQATPTSVPVVVDGDVLPARTSSCPVSSPSAEKTKQKNRKHDEPAKDKGGKWKVVVSKRKRRSARA